MGGASRAGRANTNRTEDFMPQAVENFRDRDYWIQENKLYIEPSFRLKKCARVINELAAGRQTTLLDVGCGPAALRPLLAPNVTYYGIDIAIHDNVPWLRERNIAEDTIRWDDQRFDFVVGMGFFEYMGRQQQRKFEEIRDILKDDGRFMMSYINFSHMRHKVWPNYNNVKPVSEMRKGVEQVFHVDKLFPASHNWRQKQPGHRLLPGVQMRVNFRIPVFTPMMAVEYFFLCSKKKQA
jgi:SAM-dependent methyltransferase